MNRTERKGLRRGHVALTVAIAVVLGFVGGWWLRGGEAIGDPILELADGRGYFTLASKGPAANTAISGIDGQVYPHLGNSDMNALDPSGRYLFTSHEVSDNGGLTRMDLETGVIEVLADGIPAADGLLWTPWGTLLLSEERAEGVVWEVINPLAPAAEVELVHRPAVGTRRHEGMAFDGAGNLYGVSEVSSGYIWRFTPDEPLTPRALESGALHALRPYEKLVPDSGWRVPADWVELGTEGSSGFDRPEDIERIDNVLYVSITGENRVLSIDIGFPEAPTIGEFVPPSMGLRWPDNIATDPEGNLYITEDLERIFAYVFRTQPFGAYNRVLVARQGPTLLDPAASLDVFATLKSHSDEPSGVLYDPFRDRLYVSVLGPTNRVLAVPMH